jgi:NADH-quinone oxidoreductase subunit A
MLRIHPEFQSMLAIGIQRKQVMVVVGAAVQNASLEVDSGINQGMSRAAIFRLDVVGNSRDRHVRIVPEKHSASALACAIVGVNLAGILPPHLTEWRPNRYYSKSPMSSSGLHTYAPLLLHLLIAAVLAGALTVVSVLVGWRRPTRAKQQPYECGMEPTGDAREPFSVKFYLVAMVFILFDVEAIFLYPWAYIFRSLRWYGFVEMMIYIAILLVGYLYLWKKGALDWHK